jgi:hypothetical protein
MEPSLHGIHEPECITCLYRQRYSDLQALREDAKNPAYTDAMRAAMRRDVAQEVDELLSLANEIAEKRCEGNYRAAQALFS